MSTYVEGQKYTCTFKLFCDHERDEHFSPLYAIKMFCICSLELNSTLRSRRVLYILQTTSIKVGFSPTLHC